MITSIYSVISGRKETIGVTVYYEQPHGSSYLIHVNAEE